MFRFTTTTFSWAAGDYSSDTTLTDVEISGNNVTTSNWGEGAIVDIGIGVAGAALPTNGEGEYAHLGSKNCRISGVTVGGNTIFSRTGVAVCGFLADSAIGYPWTGNRAENVTVSGNIISQRPITENDNQKTAAVVGADIIEIWYKLGFSGVDTSQMVGGNRVSGLVVSENQISAGFLTGQALFGGGFHSRVQQLGNEWEWIKGTASDTEGKAFDRSLDGEYAAKCAVNDLWVYQSFSVGDKAELGLLREGGALTVDWGAKGGFVCYAALYDKDGRMLELRKATVVATDTAVPLRFDFGQATLEKAISAKAFLLNPSTQSPLVKNAGLGL